MLTLRGCEVERCRGHRLGVCGKQQHFRRCGGRGEARRGARLAAPAKLDLATVGAVPDGSVRTLEMQRSGAVGAK